MAPSQSKADYQYPETASWSSQDPLEVKEKLTLCFQFGWHSFHFESCGLTLHLHSSIYREMYLLLSVISGNVDVKQRSLKWPAASNLCTKMQLGEPFHWVGFKKNQKEWECPNPLGAYIHQSVGKSLMAAEW